MESTRNLSEALPAQLALHPPHADVTFRPGVRDGHDDDDDDDDEAM